MSGFTTDALEKKLLDLNNSQQSIQTLSLWLIHHRRHCKGIVQTWFKELKKAKASRRLTFMYLANDVIQNSRKKGQEFTKEFSPALKAAFEVVSKEIDEKTLRSLERIIKIWAERNIYETNVLNDYKKALRPKVAPKIRSATPDREKRNVEEASVITVKKPRNVLTSSLLSQSDTPLPIKGEEVEPEKLVQALQTLEQSASSDAAVRERISKLPPEVSDLTLAEKLREQGKGEQLKRAVDDACEVLTNYNTRLARELEERKQVSIMLAAYHRYQKESASALEKKLSEYQERLKRVTRVKNDLLEHLKNLPDLSKLPSVTAGLAPLPTPGDLFTARGTPIHNAGENGHVSKQTNFDKRAKEDEDIPYDPEEHSYVPSAVKFNDAGGIATNYAPKAYNPTASTT